MEQKNYSVVRRHVGYQRLAGQEQLTLVNELYNHLRLYTNYFQPLMKLKHKERHGSQVKKTYDVAQTPYQRLLLSPDLSAAAKRRLKAEYARLNPAALKRQLERLRLVSHIASISADIPSVQATDFSDDNGLGFCGIRSYVVSTDVHALAWIIESLLNVTFNQ